MFVRKRSAAIRIITLSLGGREGRPAVRTDESLVHPHFQAAGMVHMVARSLHHRKVSDGLSRGWYVLLHGLLHRLILLVAVVVVGLALVDRRFFL